MGHEVTHSCGHSEQHIIHGMFAADIDRQARQLARRKCSLCYKTAREARSAADAASLDGIDLPALTGSEKQVRWAETIRTERLALLHRADPSRVAAFVTIIEAKWWIDNRTIKLIDASQP